MRTTLTHIETEKNLEQLSQILTSIKNPSGWSGKYTMQFLSGNEIQFRRNERSLKSILFVFTKSEDETNVIKVHVEHHDFKREYKWKALAFLLIGIVVTFAIGQPFAFIFSLLPVIIFYILSRREPAATDNWVKRELEFITSILNGKLDNLITENNIN